MTNKQDLLKLQQELPPFGIDTKYTRYIRRIHRTSGTTAKPLIVALNDTDIDAITAVGAKGFFKIIPFLIGIISGYVTAVVLGMIDFTPVLEASFFAIMNFCSKFLPVA